MLFLPNHLVPQRPCPHSQQTRGTPWSPPGALWTHFLEELVQDLGSEHSGGSPPFRPVTLSAFPRGAPCPSPRSPHPPAPSPHACVAVAPRLPPPRLTAERHPQPWVGAKLVRSLGHLQGILSERGRQAFQRRSEKGAVRGPRESKEGSAVAVRRPPPAAGCLPRATPLCPNIKLPRVAWRQNSASHRLPWGGAAQGTRTAPSGHRQPG